MTAKINPEMKRKTVSALRFHIARLRQDLAKEEGSQLIELAIVLPLLLLIFTGAVDFGRAFYVDMEVASAAESGALYGLQNPTDTAGMQAAALMDATDLASLTPTATYGTECSDGTSAVAQTGTPPTCGVSVVQYVEVDTTASYKPILSYPGLPSTFTMTGKSRMRATF